MSLPALNDLVIWKEIPQDWKRVRLKFVARFAYGDSLPSDHREEGSFPVYGSNGIVGYHKVTNTLSPAIIVGRKGSFGKVTYSESPSFAIDTTYFIDSRYSRQSLRWLYYALQTLELDKNSQDTGVPGLSRDKAYEYYLGLPPDDIQKAIASFLDRKTAAISTLIAKKQRLIQLLEEKRTALINQAVTKGMNHNIPMKDSGVPWIGKIPESWGMSALGYICNLTSGGTPDRNQQEYWNGDIPWVKTGEINYNEINETEEYITELGLINSSTKLVPPDTLLMAMYGQGVTRGRVAILGIEASFNQACLAISPQKLLEVKYLYYYFISAYKHIRDSGNETSQMNLSSGLISKFKVLLPSIEEQKAIVSFLDCEISCMNSL